MVPTRRSFVPSTKVHTTFFAGVSASTGLLAESAYACYQLTNSTLVGFRYRQSFLTKSAVDIGRLAHYLPSAHANTSTVDGAPVREHCDARTRKRDSSLITRPKDSIGVWRLLCPRNNTRIELTKPWSVPIGCAEQKKFRIWPT